MEYLDQLFTPEALLLLESANDHVNEHLTRRPHGDPIAPEDPNLNIAQQLSHERLASDSSANASESSFFSFKGTVTKANRARFDPKRRAEVAEHRKNGVCFKCKVSKSSCSNEQPCPSCKLSQAATTGRKSGLRWMKCVEYTIAGANLFAKDFPCSEERYISILHASDRIVTEDLEIALESVTTQWDLTVISTNIATWLSDSPAAASPARVVGILASSSFQRMVSPLVQDDLGKHARLLMELSSVLRSHDRNAFYAGYTSEELRYLRSFAGTKVIQGLDAALRDPRKNITVDRGRALFLVLFCVTIAVANYAQESSTSSKPSQSKIAGQAHITVQQQLLRILVHHLIFLAARIKLFDLDNLKDRLTQEDVSEYALQARYQWFLVPGTNSFSTSHPLPFTKPEKEIAANPVRQAIVTDSTERVLPHQRCLQCSEYRRWANLHNGLCLNCRLEAKIADLPGHFLSIQNIIADRNRATQLSSDAAQGDTEMTDAENDAPEPIEDVDGMPWDVNSDIHVPRGVEAADSTMIPVWEMCVWCDSRSGPDGLCDTCRSADNTSYNVEYTIFPFGDWLTLE